MSQVRLLLKAGLETNESGRLSFPCQLFDGRSNPFTQLNWNKFQIRPNSRMIEIWSFSSINSQIDAHRQAAGLGTRNVECSDTAAGMRQETNDSAAIGVRILASFYHHVLLR